MNEERIVREVVEQLEWDAPYSYVKPYYSEFELEQMMQADIESEEFVTFFERDDEEVVRDLLEMDAENDVNHLVSLIESARYYIMQQ